MKAIFRKLFEGVDIGGHVWEDNHSVNKNIMNTNVYNRLKLDKALALIFTHEVEINITNLKKYCKIMMH